MLVTVPYLNDLVLVAVNGNIVCIADLNVLLAPEGNFFTAARKTA